MVLEMQAAFLSTMNTKPSLLSSSMNSFKAAISRPLLVSDANLWLAPLAAKKFAGSLKAHIARPRFACWPHLRSVRATCRSITSLY